MLPNPITITTASCDCGTYRGTGDDECPMHPRGFSEGVIFISDRAPPPPPPDFSPKNRHQRRSAEAKARKSWRECRHG
jgi:hypothetical protein